MLSAWKCLHSPIPSSHPDSPFDPAKREACSGLRTACAPSIGCWSVSILGLIPQLSSYHRTKLNQIWYCCSAVTKTCRGRILESQIHSCSLFRYRPGKWQVEFQVSEPQESSNHRKWRYHLRRGIRISSNKTTRNPVTLHEVAEIWLPRDLEDLTHFRCIRGSLIASSQRSSYHSRQTPTSRSWWLESHKMGPDPILTSHRTLWRQRLCSVCFCSWIHNLDQRSLLLPLREYRRLSLRW